MSFLDKILLSTQKISDPKALNYLHSRGVSEAQIKALGIGYVPEEEWPPYVKGETEDIQNYLEWSSKGFRMRGKLVFPVRNPLGALRGIQIRSPDRDKKDYSKFYLQRSKVDAVFFGAELAMDSIWETERVFLCEGLFDYFPLQRIFPNTVCTGTANVSNRQIQFLERFVRDVTVVFDMDWGGNEFWTRFQRDHGSKFRTLTRLELRGKDVSEMWEAMGQSKLEERLSRQILLG